MVGQNVLLHACYGMRSQFSIRAHVLGTCWNMCLEYFLGKRGTTPFLAKMPGMKNWKVRVKSLRTGS
jgi:hypothetical protein